MISPAQRKELLETGFVRLPGAVPPEQVSAALRAINASIGEHGIDPARMAMFRERSYCPELQSAPAILDLFERSSLRPVADVLFGPGAIPPMDGAQIAVRFPRMGEPPEPRAHIDGMHSPNNGVPRGEIASFTALAAVFLSDVPEPGMGNFTVWPGTHRQNEAYFREHGPDSLLEGMPKVVMPDPEAVVAKAGDAVLAHYLLSHGIGPNVCPFPRYAVFFRLRQRNHEGHRWQAMTDAWLEWPGMAPQAQQVG